MKKILIIDSSLNIRKIIEDFFVDKKKMFYFESDSKKETEKLIKENNFFLVILNLFLDNNTNVEILELLEERSIPTIILASTFKHETLYNYSNVIDYVLKDNNGFRYIYELISVIRFCQNENVLLIKDSTENSTEDSKQVKKILKKLLLNVTIAKNKKNTLKLLNQENNFSLIIFDYETPDLDDLKLIRKVRNLHDYNNSPILIITKNIQNNLKSKFYKYGINDILLKPILKEELISKTVNIFLSLNQTQERKVFNNLIDENIIISTTNLDGTITFASDAFCEMSGYSKEELLGKNHNILKHPDMQNSIYKELWETVSSGKIWEGEIKNLKKNGDYYWVKAIVQPIFSKEKRIISYSSIRHNINEKKLIETLSITDSLTNVYNRRYFNETFPKIINDAKGRNELISFLFIDIDYFKLYNDNYGHQEGDNVLIQFASCLKNSLKRFSDFVFRIGGEEFAIIYKSTTKEKAIEFANIIKYNIENLKIKHEFSNASPYITASIGLVCKYANEVDNNEIYKQADDLLYKAKESGRNQIKINE